MHGKRNSNSTDGWTQLVGTQMSKSTTAFTVSQGRRFGLTVGAAFLVFSGIAWWRDHPTTTMVLGSLGGLLAVAGLALPKRLGPVERAWMGLAHAISKVTTPIVMGVMYLLVLAPIGWVRRTVGGNPMAHAEQGRSFWHQRAADARRSKSMRRQF
jgi:hypothetical protein